MSTKFLVNCDLNLLPTKYYKKILKSQLKNKKTRTHAYIISAKLTNNSWLNLPTDCNKLSNLKSIFYTLLISHFSLIPASLFIPNSIFICCTYLISLFSLTSQLFLGVKTFDHIKNSTNKASIMFESSINNIERSIIILSNFNTSKKSIPASISIYFYTIMPYSSISETFFFQSLNVTDFLDQYSQIYINY